MESSCWLHVVRLRLWLCKYLPTMNGDSLIDWNNVLLVLFGFPSFIWCDCFILDFTPREWQTVINGCLRLGCFSFHYLKKYVILFVRGHQLGLITGVVLRFCCIASSKRSNVTANCMHARCFLTRICKILYYFCMHKEEEYMRSRDTCVISLHNLHAC